MSKIETLLSFTIGGSDYGIDIFSVERIVRADFQKIYSIPKSSSEVLGMYSLKKAGADDVFPIFDMAQLMAKFEPELKETINRETNTFTIIKCKSGGFSAGLCISDEPDFISVDDLEITLKDVVTVTEVNEKPIKIINIDKLFPNVSVVASSGSSSSDDLDLSQYVLDG